MFAAVVSVGVQIAMASANSLTAFRGLFTGRAFGSLGVSAVVLPWLASARERSRGAGFFGRESRKGIGALRPGGRESIERVVAVAILTLRRCRVALVWERMVGGIVVIASLVESCERSRVWRRLEDLTRKVQCRRSMLKWLRSEGEGGRSGRRRE